MLDKTKIEIISTTLADANQLEKNINNFLSDLDSKKIMDISIVHESLAYVVYKV